MGYQGIVRSVIWKIVCLIFGEIKIFIRLICMGMNSRSRIENFKGIYRRAKKEGLRLKAHVGEWGTAKDIRTAVEELELDEVQHGIAAAGDESVIRFLAENKIRLNITPTSNVLLGRVADMAEHPIGKLYRSGIDVTINSDDVLFLIPTYQKNICNFMRHSV